MVPNFTLLSLLTLLLLFPQKSQSDEAQINCTIGAIIDYNSRIGKEAKVAMNMAIEDVFGDTNLSMTLITKHSQPDDTVQAALAAMELINNTHQPAQVIVGPQTWEETSVVAGIGSKANIPIVSLADATPSWATDHWPYLVQAFPNQYAQMKAVAAIAQSFDWHQVTAIYEDTDSSINRVIPHLSDALEDVGSELVRLIALPPFVSSSLSVQLEKLKGEQCRVFVVDLSFPVATRLFEIAHNLGMMEKDYVWITTSSFTSLVHSLNSSILSTMQGVIGLNSYYPENGTMYQDFYSRFMTRFSSEYPQEKYHEPGIFAMQAYDAIWAVALATRESNNSGQHLLNNIMSTHFDGLAGRIHFVDRKSAPARIFQIINVIGKSYREVGFWSDGLGFSKSLNERSTYNSSMKNIWVFWPGGPLTAPIGWPTEANPLRVGVPAESGFKEYVDVYQDSQNETKVRGFSIDVFEAAVKELPYYLPYEFIPFNGTSYEELIQQVYLKQRFDAAVGDISIVAKRYQYVEFTHPYTDTGLVMIVPVRSQTLNKSLLFMKPFTISMWVLIGIVTIYNGFAIWFMERNEGTELQGSFFNQVGTVLYLSFTTLFSLHGERLHNNLSRMTMVVWLFVALIVIQTYTANLASILTVKRLEPAITDIKSLQNSNATVGYCTGSYIGDYLNTVLDFKRSNIKNYTSPEQYAHAFESKEIAAAFLEVPFARIFLAKYCKSFVIAGPTYQIGGFGFVFPKRSAFVPDITKALLKVSESGKLREMENKMLESQKCAEEEGDNEIQTLSPSSFWVPFMLTGCTTTVALTVYGVHNIWRQRLGILRRRSIWRLIWEVMKHWKHRMRRISPRVTPAQQTI